MTDIPHICRFLYATFFSAWKKYSKKLFVNSQQNSVNLYLKIWILVGILVFCLAYLSIWYLGIPNISITKNVHICVYIFWTKNVHICVYIFWTNNAKRSIFHVFCGKNTPAWKTTTGSGGSDYYELWWLMTDEWWKMYDECWMMDDDDAEKMHRTYELMLMQMLMLMLILMLMLMLSRCADEHIREAII